MNEARFCCAFCTHTLAPRPAPSNRALALASTCRRMHACVLAPCFRCSWSWLLPAPLSLVSSRLSLVSSRSLASCLRAGPPPRSLDNSRSPALLRSSSHSIPAARPRCRRTRRCALHPRGFSAPPQCVCGCGSASPCTARDGHVRRAAPRRNMPRRNMPRRNMPPRRAAVRGVAAGGAVAAHWATEYGTKSSRSSGSSIPRSRR